MTLIGVLGAGGQAREVADFAPGAEVAFFAVDEPYFSDGARVAGVPLIDLTRASAEERALPVVVAVGAPGLRNDLVSRWPGERYTSVLAEHGYRSPRATIADGCIVAPGATLMADCVLERHVLVNAGATIGHGTVIEAFATLSPGVHVGGDSTIGRGSFIGIGASVANGVTVGEGVRIGAGAVVLNDLEPWGVYVGIPARRVRRVEEWLRGF
ncbi:MAG: acetyltransferase [Microthrixaceae bacterium]|nr:acetyltransferase [Microthrixaceae bacterium]